MKCYNCQGVGHIAKSCSSPKREATRNGGSTYSRTGSTNNGSNTEQGN
jgi:hypothetical protein